MKVFLAIVLTIISYSNGVLGMDCNFGTSKNILDKVIHTCPRPIIDSSNEEYCCIKDNDVTCCDFTDFVGSSIIFFLPYIIAFLVISCIISCICCLCCRRSGGRVYGAVPPSTLAQRIVIVPAGSNLQQRNTVYPPEVYPASAPLIYTAQ